MGWGGTEWSVGCRPSGQSLICNCVVPGARLLHKPTERKRQAKLPQKVSANLPLVCPHHGENEHKWSSETLPDVALDGKRVLKQRSGRVPDQRDRGARWHITASLCAAIPRMRHSGVGKFASDQQGEGWPDSIAKCWWGCCSAGLLS